MYNYNFFFLLKKYFIWCSSARPCENRHRVSASVDSRFFIPVRGLDAAARVYDAHVSLHYYLVVKIQFFFWIYGKYKLSSSPVASWANIAGRISVKSFFFQILLFLYLYIYVYKNLCAHRVTRKNVLNNIN